MIDTRTRLTEYAQGCTSTVPCINHRDISMSKEQYLVLARKWRPQTFDDVVGQAHITRTLQNSLRSGRIHHAFLFIGSRGIGKTTSARILAKALNCTAQDGPTPEPCGVCANCESIAAGTNINVIEILSLIHI